MEAYYCRLKVSSLAMVGVQVSSCYSPEDNIGMFVARVELINEGVPFLLRCLDVERAPSGEGIKALEYGA